ncbi:uncharacterized protein DNG_06340 [Cephalotrichum gorgonifer]|uniref:Uncharacterized protein n=1 Tax=Cephalotrichum gorgonifer TaxID=2041049 RepID=A0AAE8N2K5_9PEZI|nr:uncharacterized protein DNG_06340 [Cephalotrichum gorgonifer]
MDGSTTKWIGVNTEYLTEETRTTTVDNVEVTTVVKPQLAVVTATEASEGVDVGDVTVLVSDTVQDEMDAIIKQAVASCGAPAKLRKRDSTSCIINALQGAAQNDEALGLINPAEWESFGLELVDSAPGILSAAFQVFKTRAQKNKFALLVGAAAAFGAFVAEPAAEVGHKFIFEGGLFGFPGSDGGNNENDPTPTEPTTTTSTSTCDPSATVDENSPACDDEDCKGEGKGEKKNCPCVKWTKKMVEGLFDKDWANEQQKILQELEAGVPDVIPPQCFRNTYGDGFDGKPRAEPSAFCRCSSIGGPGTKTEGNYATMSGEGDDACTYTTMPTETISITLRPKETTVTSCRLESTEGDSYCTCNDDKMHGSIVTTYQGKETTVCPDATATMTSIETPTAEPSCYPTHGPPHDNPANDELLKLCGAGKSEFAGVCRTKMGEGLGYANVGCPNAGAGTQNPIQNNHYGAQFEKADNAPEECNYLFGLGGSDNDDEVGVRVDALCIPVFEAIRDKCSWNGGEAKTPCGTFKYQSCPLGSKCNFGNPGRPG